MAAADNDQLWERDPVVDANPDLTRKRQRMSEDSLPSPSVSITTAVAAGTGDAASNCNSSDHGSVIIEALAAEDLSVDTPIQLQHEHADNATAMAAVYSAEFAICAGVTGKLPPIEQIHKLHQHINSKRYLSVDAFHHMATRLRMHVDQTRPDDVWRIVYPADQEFYAALGHLLSDFLSGDEIFNVEEALRYRRDVLDVTIADWYVAVIELSARVVTCLPEIIKATIARRDSGQVRSQQHVGLLWFVTVLDQALTGYGAPAMMYFQQHFELQLDSDECRGRAGWIQDLHVIPSLALLLERLCQCHREVVRSWDAIGAILHVSQSLDFTVASDAERVMDSVQHHILPLIRDKHPRALPDGFHDSFVETAGSILRKLVITAPSARMESLYDRFIESESDALIPQTIKDTSWAEIIKHLTHGETRLTVELLLVAWTLQTLKAFVHSEIMDVRTIGMRSLSVRLASLFNLYHESAYGSEHPVLQYVARFMRSNEFTKYIFGPNSHASLVSHSGNIIGFLAATYAYTDLDTDIIWDACTNTVEAEFVKASFVVINDLTRYLEWERMLYLVRKYTTTPPYKLGRDAVEVLGDLFLKITGRSVQSQDPEGHLATAFISIDIMKRCQGYEDVQSTAKLCNVARNELARFAHGKCAVKDQIRILKSCIEDFMDKNDNATASADILVLFLRSINDPTNYQALLEQLPIYEVLEELKYHTEQIRQSSGRSIEYHVPGIVSRFELTLRLLALASREPNETTVQIIFRHFLSDLAVDATAREEAWSMLRMLINMQQPAYMCAFLDTLLMRLLETEITKLPLEHITTSVAELLYRGLGIHLRSEAMQQDFTALLDLPAWQKLIEIVERSPNGLVRNNAVTMITGFLFDMPLQPGCPVIPRSSILACHQKFIEQLVDRLHAAHAAMKTSSEQNPSHASETETVVLQEIDLLHATLIKSKNTIAQYEGSPCPQISLDEDSTEGEAIQCLIYLTSGPVQKKVLLQARSTTPLAALAVHLTPISGAPSHRAIRDGRAIEISEQAAVPIADVILFPSAIMIVMARHGFTDDIDLILPPPGTVEKGLLAQYARLETLMEGEGEVARKMYILLRDIRPPKSARQRITTPGAVIDHVFPKGSPWKAAFSIFTLHSHLHEFYKLAVVDDDFLSSAIRLLAALLVDPERLKLAMVRSLALAAVNDFLSETPNDTSSSLVLVDDPTTLVSTMVENISGALNTAVADRNVEHLRLSLATMSYTTLLKLSKRQPAVWQTFIAHDDIVDLHARIFLDRSIFSIVDHIRNFCKDLDADRSAADFYLNVIVAALPTALSHAHQSSTYFAFATDILYLARGLKTDEQRVRKLVETVEEQLWLYEHSERVDCLIHDSAMLGLLKLMSCIVDLLKSFKKPLAFPDLSLRIFKTLLFPSPEDPNARPVLHEESRRLAFGLVRAACESAETFEALLGATDAALRSIESFPLEVPRTAEYIRPATLCCGLDNLGMTCYMNSLLQQLYANVHFRKFILELPIPTGAMAEKQPCLAAVQELFARMQNLVSYSLRPVELAQILGIRTDSQEDVHGFYEDFLSRLESEMPDEISKAQLSRFYTGRLLSQIKGECGHVSTRTEPFVDLQILVKNKPGLKEGLDELVQGEPMQGANKYKCLACDPLGGEEGRLVDAMKRACPEELPDNLTFCLKRFSFEAMLGMDDKVNDRFEFPQTIDMAAYQHANIEKRQQEGNTQSIDPDVFELVGVIVHQGTLQFGHYWSYTLLRNTSDPRARVWVKLEDRSVSACPQGIVDVQRECTGGEWCVNGQERADNAYVLFYQRRHVLEECLSTLGEVVVDTNSGDLIPPRVQLPLELEERMKQENFARHLVRQLTHEDFANLGLWLAAEAPTTLELSPEAKREDDHESDLSESGDGATPAAENDMRGGCRTRHYATAAVYVDLLKRVAASDEAPSVKLGRFREFLPRFLEAKPEMAYPLLDRFLDNHFWVTFLYFGDRNARKLGIDVVLKRCLNLLRETDHAQFRKIVTRMVGHMALLVDDRYEEFARLNWLQLLDLSTYVAGLGAWETGQILEAGILRWALQMLCVLWDTGIQAKYPTAAALIKRRPVQVSAVYRFVHAVLSSSHVGIGELVFVRADGNMRTITADGTMMLTQEEAACLRHCTSGGQPVSSWMRTVAFADRTNLDEFAPARLLVLLLDPEVSPQLLRDHIPIALRSLIDIEEECLEPWLCLLQHFCAVATALGNYTAASAAVRTLAKTIVFWDGNDSDFLRFLQATFPLAPRAIAEHVALWYEHFLVPSGGKNVKNISVRNAVGGWIAKKLFAPPGPGAALVDPGLEVIRAGLARRMVASLVGVVRAAYGRELARARFEPILTVLAGIASYVRALQVAVADAVDAEEEAQAAVEDEEVVIETIPRALTLECDELKRTLAVLEPIETLCEEWEGEDGGMEEVVVRSVEPKVIVSVGGGITTGEGSERDEAIDEEMEDDEVEDDEDEDDEIAGAAGPVDWDEQHGNGVRAFAVR